MEIHFIEHLFSNLWKHMQLCFKIMKIANNIKILSQMFKIVINISLIKEDMKQKIFYHYIKYFIKLYKEFKNFKNQMKLKIIFKKILLMV